MNFRFKNVLFTILDMGLGHASRSLPVIQALLRRNCRVTVGSSGRSLAFLKKELSSVNWVQFPEYGLHYSKSGIGLNQMFVQTPRLLKVIRQETRIVSRLVQENSHDLIFSDHRYGCYHPVVPSFFISHQLRFIAPPLLKSFEFLGKMFNRHYHRRFRAVIVPDVLVNGEGQMTGRLSGIRLDSHYFFPGIFSSIARKGNQQKEVDWFISISGPEPQRSLFEKIIREQIFSLPGSKVVALGQPESNRIEKPAVDVTIFSHLNRNEMTDYFNRSRLVVCRSGYSTLMELAEIGKKALLVPTPGQTEQIYLADRFRKNHWLFSVKQDQLNLKEQVKTALTYSGLPFRLSTRETIQNLFRWLDNFHGD